MTTSTRNKAPNRRGAQGLAVLLSCGIAVIAETSILIRTAQAQSRSPEYENKQGKGDGKNSRTEDQLESDAEKGSESSSLLEEVRQMRRLMNEMRQMMERQEARISQLEAERRTLEAEKNGLEAKKPDVITNPADANGEARQTVTSNVRRLSFPYRWFPTLRPSVRGAGATPSPALSGGQPTHAAPASPSASTHVQPAAAPQAQAPALSAEDRDTLDFWNDTTINVVVDGYYGYNFNRPLGGINLLRANDVLSNSFSLSQAGVIFEQEPKPDEGRRFGARLDLMFGQITETLQGNAVNELRPQVYRHIWQAYGTYVAPVGNGLRVDFGKFASALGYETVYTKDNFNYSRSYWFFLLPYYHTGFRVTYPFNEKFTGTYLLVNGINQSEDFNNWKSQAVFLTFKPTSRITAQANYYVGREGRVRTSVLNPTFPVLPTAQPGFTPVEVSPEPNGRAHIIDVYGTYNVTDRLTFALQGDYLINRTFNNSSPARDFGGAAYARYQFSPGFALAGRFEYLSDGLAADGLSLLSGLGQALKEVTLTAEYKFGEGFLLRGEYRRDWSNQPFFLTAAPGALKKEQNTATLGLVWWFGRKKGVW